MMFRDLSMTLILLASRSAMNKNNPFLSPHMLDGHLNVAEVGLPPSPVSVLAPVPAMVDRVWVERESILIR
jgi:hypothetical protein